MHLKSVLSGGKPNTLITHSTTLTFQAIVIIIDTETATHDTVKQSKRVVIVVVAGSAIHAFAFVLAVLLTTALAFISFFFLDFLVATDTVRVFVVDLLESQHIKCLAFDTLHKLVGSLDEYVVNSSVHFS
jgi:hypothetical protein